MKIVTGLGLMALVAFCVIAVLGRIDDGKVDFNLVSETGLTADQLSAYFDAQKANDLNESQALTVLTSAVSTVADLYGTGFGTSKCNILARIQDENSASPNGNGVYLNGSERMLQRWDNADPAFHVALTAYALSICSAAPPPPMDVVVTPSPTPRPVASPGWQ